MSGFEAFNLWTLFVSYLSGSFWVAVLLLALLIFIIMAILGRLSKLSIMFYILTFFMAMSVGYGLKWITVLISFLILLFAYLAIRNVTDG